jgi:hypothetical protein
MAACSHQAEPRAVDESKEIARPNSAAVWLGQARAAHAAGELAGLRALAASNVPSAIAAEDAASVKRGLYAHAAKRALELGLAQDAERLVQDGLALAGRDPFRTQLLLLDVEVQRAFGNTVGEATAQRAARLDLGLD